MACTRNAHQNAASLQVLISEIDHLHFAVYSLPCRPAELRHGMVAALSKMAQGQAQAIIAHRAEVKNTTPSALASLYCGATGTSPFPSFVLPGVFQRVLIKQLFWNCFGLADLFEEASAVLKASGDVKQTAESLRKVLALSSTYNKVKAWQAMAAHEAAQSDMGIACADLQVLHLSACCS